MFNKIKAKNAFTLAEVLITLVIIGIVAALTISAVINTYVERSTVSKVKKGLSTLAQAKKLAEAQNGPVAGWNFGNGWTAQTASDFWKYLKPYLSVAKDCGSSTACYHSDRLRVLNGTSLIVNYNQEPSYYKFVLSDGSVMWFRTGGSSSGEKCTVSNGGVDNACAIFWYDINGEKSPNTIGRDVFVYILSVYGVYPHLNNSCNKNSDGFGCSGYIIKNNNMNYLH